MRSQKSNAAPALKRGTSGELRQAKLAMQPSKPQSETGRIESLTAMRGIAAVLVMFFHLRFALREVPGINIPLFYFPLGLKGYLWVDFFFILSGFVLSHRYAPTLALTARDAGSFVFARWARIYPLHFVTFAAAAFAKATTTGFVLFQGSSLKSIAAELSLVHGWGFGFPSPINYPSWSLSSEWLCSLLFPLLVIASRRIGKSKALALVATVLTLGALASYSLMYRAGSLDLTDVTRDGWLRCLCEFSVGMLVYEIHSALPESFRRFGGVLAGASFLSLIALLWFAGPETLFAPLAALMVLGLASDRGAFARLLEARLFLWLGTISFSIYMWHASVFLAFEGLYISLGKPHWPVSVAWSLPLLLVASVLLISHHSHRLIELGLHARLKAQGARIFRR